MSNTTEDPKRKAKRLGLDLVKPKADELFVDLDSVGAFGVFLGNLKAFADIFGKPTVEFTESRNGNVHAYVRVHGHAFTDAERVALQASLGSDPKREMLSVYAKSRGMQSRYVSVFFEKPNVKKKSLPIMKGNS